MVKWLKHKQERMTSTHFVPCPQMLEAGGEIWVFSSVISAPHYWGWGWN